MIYCQVYIRALAHFLGVGVDTGLQLPSEHDRATLPAECVTCRTLPSVAPSLFFLFRSQDNPVFSRVCYFPPRQPSSPGAGSAEDAKFRRLLEMGFDPARTRAALAEAGGDESAAISKLLQG